MRPDSRQARPRQKQGETNGDISQGLKLQWVSEEKGPEVTQQTK